MTLDALSIVAALVGFVAAFAAGFLVGRRSRRWPGWGYWVANAVGLVLGLSVVTLGLMNGMAWIWMAGLGVIAGSLTGLKYGLAAVVGQWKSGPGAGAPDEDDPNARTPRAEHDREA